MTMYLGQKFGSVFNVKKNMKQEIIPEKERIVEFPVSHNSILTNFENGFCGLNSKNEIISIGLKSYENNYNFNHGLSMAGMNYFYSLGLSLIELDDFSSKMIDDNILVVIDFEKHVKITIYHKDFCDNYIKYINEITQMSPFKSSNATHQIFGKKFGVQIKNPSENHFLIDESKSIEGLINGCFICDYKNKIKIISCYLKIFNTLEQKQKINDIEFF